MFIFAAGWLLVLLGAVAIFGLVVPTNFSNSTIINGLLKGVAGALISAGWLAAFLGMRNLLIKKNMRQKKANADTE